MNLKDLKTLAETARPKATNKTALAQWCTDTLAAYPNDAEVSDLVSDVQAAKDAAAVTAVLDAVKAK